MSNGAPDTGGVDIGHWGQVGGEIPGLNAVHKVRQQDSRS